MDFSRAMLSRGSLQNCLLKEAKFNHSILFGVKFAGSMLYAVSFVGAGFVDQCKFLPEQPPSPKRKALKDGKTAAAEDTRKTSELKTGRKPWENLKRAGSGLLEKLKKIPSVNTPPSNGASKKPPPKGASHTDGAHFQQRFDSTQTFDVEDYEGVDEDYRRHYQLAFCQKEAELQKHKSEIEHLMANMAKLADMEIVADNWQGVYDAWRAMERLWDVGVMERCPPNSPCSPSSI